MSSNPTSSVAGGGPSLPDSAEHRRSEAKPPQARTAAELLDRLPPDEYPAQWTAHFAQPYALGEREAESGVLFRLGAEWYVFSSSVVEEIAHLRAIHSIPHRRSRAIAGITNIRGELLVCISLAALLDVEAAPAAESSDARGTQRLLVLRREDVHAVCQVDEVAGVIRFDARTLTEVPGTLAHKGSRYSRKLLPWRERFVGLLDDQLLFYTIKRSLA
jgi:chemotaxis-related protein WspD